MGSTHVLTPPPPTLPCSAAPAVGLTAAFYCLVGLFGYLNFPTDAHSNILLNYPGGALKLSQCLR